MVDVVSQLLNGASAQEGRSAFNLSGGNTAARARRCVAWGPGQGGPIYRAASSAFAAAARRSQCSASAKLPPSRRAWALAVAASVR
jgi:hypothetical protein